MEGAHEGMSLLRDGVPLLGFALVFVLIFRRLGLGIYFPLGRPE